MARRRSTSRGKGEGSVFERPDGTWRGKVTVGYDNEGKQKFRWVPGKTQGEALAKVAEIKQRLSNGTYTDTKLMVGDYRKDGSSINRGRSNHAPLKPISTPSSNTSFQVSDVRN